MYHFAQADMQQSLPLPDLVQLPNSDVGCTMADRQAPCNDALYHTLKKTHSLSMFCKQQSATYASTSNLYILLQVAKIQ